MVGKLGLVGAVGVALLLTFVLVGGDVMPSISAHEASTVGKAGATRSVSPTDQAGTSPAGTPSATPADGASDTLAQAAAAAEKLAGAAPVPGEVLTDKPDPRRAAPPPVLTFRMATFNALGSSHTRGKSHRKQKASGPARTARAGQYVLDNNIDLVGFQEMQGDQRNAFMGATGGRFALYPGDSLRSMDGENSIAYRLDTWELVKADSVPIPYFGGNPRNMPILLLRNKQTGITAYFANFHNPADTAQFGNQARWRAAAKAREVELLPTLRDSGYPVFVTGDMNEQQSWFCSVAGPGDLKAAAGGDGGRNGCSVAGGFRIDWIVGSYDAQFSNYREDKSGVVAWMTDHAVMSTDVTVDAAKFPKSVAGQP